MSVTQQLNTIRDSLPQDVTLVAVSKTHPVEMIQEAYEAGQRIFGENRVQELLEKVPELPNDIQWHLIGHLQRNKVKQVLPHVSLIHSVDSLRLLNTIQKEAEAIDRKCACLIQLHIAQEDAKYGFSYEEAKELFSSGHLATLTHVDVKGLMGMATFTDDSSQVSKEFTQLHQFYTKIIDEGLAPSKEFHLLSMGMSGDYKLAIAAGSNMVRIGSDIFGHRNYN